MFIKPVSIKTDLQLTAAAANL